MDKLVNVNSAAGAGRFDAHCSYSLCSYTSFSSSCYCCYYDSLRLFFCLFL